MSSAETMGYDAVLDSLLRDRLAARNPLIRDVTTPRELTAAIEGFRPCSPIPGVWQLWCSADDDGQRAASSLYIRRFRELLIDDEIKKRTLWSFVDFNSSPPSLDNSQDWLCETFVASFEKENRSLDLNSETAIDAIFSADISKNKAVYARIGA